MAHKTLIGGTAYEVIGGKTLIGGTAYKIAKGRTLVNGTGYDITFETVEDMLDELFSTMTIVEEEITNAAANYLEITAVANSYYLYTAPVFQDYPAISLSYFDGTTCTLIWDIFPSTHDGRSGVGYNSANNTIYPIHGSTHTPENYGQNISRVTFTVDPAELLSHLSMFDWSASDSSTSETQYVSYANRTNPSYYICRVTGYSLIYKLKDGVLTALYSDPNAVTDPCLYLSTSNTRIYYSLDGTSSAKGRGVLAGFNFTP